jgi:hypothetical protein
MGHFRQSKRRASSFLSDPLHILCSPAWTVKIQNLISDALSEPYCQLQTELAKQSQLYVDESPTKQHKAKVWLWVAVAPMFADFGIFATRSQESLVALFEGYSKIILNCDRAEMYLDGPRLQWCWAHLTRDIQSPIDSRYKQVKRLGRDLMRQEACYLNTGNETNAQRSIGKHSGDWRAPFARISIVFFSGAVIAAMPS